MERPGIGWLAGGIIRVLLRDGIGPRVVLGGRGDIILWVWFRRGGGRDIMAPERTFGGGKRPLLLKGLGRAGVCLEEQEFGLNGTGTEVGLKGPGGGNGLGLNGPGIGIGLKTPGGGGALLAPIFNGGFGTNPLFSVGWVIAGTGAGAARCELFFTIPAAGKVFLERWVGDIGEPEMLLVLLPAVLKFDFGELFIAAASSVSKPSQRA